MIWKLLPEIGRLLFWFALAWVLFGLVFNRRSARVINEGRVEFARDPIAICAWLFIIGFMASPATRRLAHSPENPWDIVILASLGLAALSIPFSFAGTIIANSDGLDQLYWFRRKKHIRWKDIDEIKTGAKNGLVTITSADGTQIIHSPKLAGRRQFMLEIQQHCGDDLPPEFPRVPFDPR